MRDALPPRYRATNPLVRGADYRGRRRIKNLLKVLVPPHPQRFRRFGRSVIVPPARIELPSCIEIGDDVVVHEHVWFSVVRRFPDVEPRLVLNDHVRIGRGCQLSVIGEVVIDRGAIIGDFVQLGDTYHPYESGERLATLVRPVPVRIGKGAVICGHAIVLPGVTVGDGAYVEHHSVVNKDVPPGAVVAGRPAKIIDQAEA
jgi:acetyltransferase-like isoleucine patch superfamily enzyme